MASMMDLYQKKYCILKRKCEELHQTNEKLVNRLHHVKRVLKRYKNDRRMLGDKLDDYEDDFHDTEQPLMLEEHEVKKEPCASSDLPANPQPNPQQETVAMVPPADMATLETDTSPSLASTSTTITRVAPLGR